MAQAKPDRASREKIRGREVRDAAAEEAPRAVEEVGAEPRGRSKEKEVR